MLLKKMNNIIAAILVIASGGCATRVARLDVGEVVDLSGRWNDTDSALVAEALIEQCLEKSWYKRFAKKESRTPVVIVGSVHNKTLEHINVQTFVKDLERAMLNSGAIELVASSSERTEVRNERKEMQRWTSLSTRKKLYSETASDFMLKGVLNAIVDEEKGKKVVFYQADLNLINTHNNSIIWAGQKKLKKFIKKPLFKL